MPTGKIIWLKVTQELRRWLPVDEPTPADHRPYFVMRDGCPDLCCEKHRFYPRD